MDGNKREDPRLKSTKYDPTTKMSFNFMMTPIDFGHTQFTIDENYVGEPPHVQIGIENINDNIDEKFLAKDLMKLGNIKLLEILRHPVTKEHLGLAKVEFWDAKVAGECVAAFNGKQMMGKQLNVFIDVRFTILEAIKEAKLNPRTTGPIPQLSNVAQTNSILPPPPPHLLGLSRLSGNGIATPLLPNIPLLQPNELASGTLLPHQQTNSHLTPSLAMSTAAHHQLHKSNSLGNVSSPMSLEYPMTTPSSMNSSSATPEPSARPRLEDRIANLLKKPNNALSSIVGPPVTTPTPMNPSKYHAVHSSQPLSSHHHRSFNSANNEIPNHEYSNNSNSNYHSSQTISSYKSDRGRYRSDRESDHRRSDINNHHRESKHHHNHYQSSKSPRYERNSSSHKSDRYFDDASNDSWNVVDKPLEIPTLTEEQIKEIILPDSFDCYRRHLFDTLFSNTFKRLKEQHGYPCIERSQAAHKAKLDEAKRKIDKARYDREMERNLTRIYMTKDRMQTKVEPSRPRANVLRQRMPVTDENRAPRVDQQRRVPVNRSSTFVGGTGHSSADSSLSSDESSESSYSSLSSESSSSDDDSDSGSSSASSPSGSSSSLSSRSSIQASRKKKSERKDRSSFLEESDSGDERQTKSRAAISSSETIAPVKLDVSRSKEEIDVCHLLIQLGSGPQPAESKSSDIKPETETKKRKKKKNEAIGFASEFRAAKRFAAGAQQQLYENFENSTFEDENFQETKPETKHIFPERSTEEKQRLLDDLYSTLSEEDIKYLAQVHEKEGIKSSHDDYEIPFGSDQANKAHLGMRKQMIEGKAAEGHPKWWTGCSRCDVIKVSEECRKEPEETNYEDLTRAPIKSHTMQATSRRDNKSDQRRVVAANSDIADEHLKMFTKNSLQRRARNLRFSRSNIHKWGLFACQNIASGEAVIEYVGEKIRPSLADHREKKVYTNLPTHDGSSYFFRVDHDVIDATLKGNHARFINHSCNPNCIAKVIKHDNGSNSIVIYAKQAIREDEEITYDYKFPREENKIQCNCKAPNCQKFLN